MQLENASEPCDADWHCKAGDRVMPGFTSLLYNNKFDHLEHHCEKGLNPQSPLIMLQLSRSADFPRLMAGKLRYKYLSKLEHEAK